MTLIEKAWYSKAWWLVLLWPLSVVFRILIGIRRRLQHADASADETRPPVILVGNLTVGGTGKTPTLIGLAKFLQQKGFKPGVISRGYGGEQTSYPLVVEEDTPAAQAGDEPVLIAGTTGCPVVVDPDRLAALKHLTANYEVDVVLSDDGLQHYRLPRDIEICVVDGQRLFGNGWCLPAGPLREPVSRLKDVDFVVVNGDSETDHPALEEAASLRLLPKFLINLASGEKRPFGGAPFNIGNTVQAVSAIGNPERFYTTLEKLPYRLERFSFPDHHLFDEEDFEARGIDERQPVVMTEKDAVKCAGFARANFWYLHSEVELPAEFLERIGERIAALR